MKESILNNNQGFPSLNLENKNDNDIWFAINHPIEDFINPKWIPHPKRYSVENVSKTNPGSLGSEEIINLAKIVGINGIHDPKIRVLDVGGGSGAEPFSLLHQGKYVYIIDPTIGTFGTPIKPHRTWQGYAQDMPFIDKSFFWTISTRSVGWYTKLIDPFWALHEMIRVSQARVSITIEQDAILNKANLIEGLEKVEQTNIGRRIRRAEWFDTELALLLER